MFVVVHYLLNSQKHHLSMLERLLYGAVLNVLRYWFVYNAAEAG